VAPAARSRRKVRSAASTFGCERRPSVPSSGLRGDARVRVSIENDGNEVATGLRLTLKLEFGRGRVRPPLRACRGERAIVCELPQLAAGGATPLTVPVADPRPVAFGLRTSVSSAELDSGAVTNASDAYVRVLDCDIVGTDRRDLLRGTPGRDSICGRPERDAIRAGPGNDTIDGGSGGDVIYPGSGRDVVVAADGADSIYARDGELDVIDCGPAQDTVRADRLDRLTRCERVVR